MGYGGLGRGGVKGDVVSLDFSSHAWVLSVEFSRNKEVMHGLV